MKSHKYRSTPVARSKRRGGRSGRTVPDSSPPAPDDRTQGAENALRKYISENADAFLKELVKQGCDETRLISLLWVIPRASNQRVPWVAGMSFQDLLELPEQMIDLAQKLERCSASPFLGPDRFTDIAEMYRVNRMDAHHVPFPLNLVYAKGADAVLAKLFASLPSRLRLYAEYLRERLPSLKRFDQIARHGFRPQTLATLKLLKLVKDSTGHYYYDDIANLLEAAYRQAGRDRSIDPDGLRKLNHNNPFLRATLYSWLFGPAQKPHALKKKRRPDQTH